MTNEPSNSKFDPSSSRMMSGSRGNCSWIPYDEFCERGASFVAMALMIVIATETTANQMSWNLLVAINELESLSA